MKACHPPSAAHSHGRQAPLTGLDPAVEDWGKSFRKQLKQNRLAGQGLTTLVKAGCLDGVIAELLYIEVEVGRTKRRGVVGARKEWNRRTKLLQRDLDGVADSLEWIDSYWRLSELKSEFHLVACDGEETRVPATFVKYLPSFLRQYGRLLHLIRRSGELPFPPTLGRVIALPILSAYVRKVTGRPHYSEISHLLTAAHAVSGVREEPGAEAIRKSIDRFKKHRPGLSQEIDDLTSAYLKYRPGDDYWKFVYISLLIAHGVPDSSKPSPFRWK